jgi:hypothetical protein
MMPARYRRPLTLASIVALLSVLLFSAYARGASSLDEYGIASVSASLSTDEAGAHPDFTTTVQIKTDPSAPPDEFGHELPIAGTRSVEVQLPPGLIGNPNAVAQCTSLQFATSFTGGGCPQDSQVGVAIVRLYFFPTQLTEPIFNMEAPGGDSVARLAFFGANQPVFINVGVRSASDYGLTATLEGIPGNELLVSAETTLWAVPADHSHDTQRLTAREAYPEGLSESPPRESGLKPAPFMTNPTSCEGPLQVRFAATTYQVPGLRSEASAPLPPITDCEALGFAPEFEAIPTSSEAASTAGLSARLRIPQNETLTGRATSALRDALVRLPAGLTLAPGAADGLEACSAEQAGYRHSPSEAAHCPSSAKIGSIEIDVPQLPRRLRGDVYQRSPEPGDLFRIWLIADDLGVHLKIPGEIHLDPRDGQITSLFLDTPQVPLREFELDFKGGSRGVLATPTRCGDYASEFAFTPWSGGAEASGTAPMRFDQACDIGGFAPRLSAGSTSPVGGRFSTLITEITRRASEENLAEVDLTLPPGLLARLAGVPLCPEELAASGSCSSASQIGSVAVATGPGSTPLWIPQPGRPPTAVYLAGPYRGAPYSLVVVTPAQAGPFDLGTVIVRAAISIDPDTAVVGVHSDPLPQILAGVPLSYRDLEVTIDRPDFALNPTSCDPTSFASSLASAAGTVAHPTARFQVAGCGSLRFKPRLSLRLKGATARTSHPRLIADLRMRPHEANIARAQVKLPKAAFLDQGNIATICTRVQFAADNCPAGSVYGKATATTPLLDNLLSGPVYLRSSSHNLPDLVVKLKGPDSQPIEIDLAGKTDSIKGALRNTFEAVPDAPVTKFHLELFGAKHGLIILSAGLCKSPKAQVQLDGQNGKVFDTSPVVKTSCKPRKLHKSAKKHRISRP